MNLFLVVSFLLPVRLTCSYWNPAAPLYSFCFIFWSPSKTSYVKVIPATSSHNVLWMMFSIGLHNSKLMQLISIANQASSTAAPGESSEHRFPKFSIVPSWPCRCSSKFMGTSCALESWIWAACKLIAHWKRFKSYIICTYLWLLISTKLYLQLQDNIHTNTIYWYMHLW